MSDHHDDDHDDDHGHQVHPHHEHEHDHRPSRTLVRYCDVAVIGGSAAGLAVALQLGRLRRSVIVIDAGKPRNVPAAHMHGYLGYEGAAPATLIDIAREEVRSYGGEVLSGRVLDISRESAQFRVAVTGGHSIVARRVVAATGLIDELPDIEGIAEQWGRDVFHCPFCHGYEIRDQRLVHIVTHPMGLHPAALLRQLSERYTIVLHESALAADPHVATLRAAGVQVLEAHVARVVTGENGRVASVELSDGSSLPADAVMVGTRMNARADVFASLGLLATPHPSGLGEIIEADAMGATAVPGVFAAGNVTDPSHQVLHAAAHGTRVGATVSFSLAEEDLQAAVRTSANEADWDQRYGGEQMWSGNPNGSLVAEVTGLPVGRALDVGAGEGGDAGWLAEQGWSVTASDISQRGLDRVAEEASRRGVAVTCLRADANAVQPFEAEAYTLVSAHYASIPRTPDGRGLRNVLGAVARGGLLLVVGHDPAPMRHPVDPDVNTRIFDPDAYVRVDDFRAAVEASPDWQVELHELRPRPAGAASHHVHDVVLRARRRPE